jgi:hypothetical protein
MAGLSFASMVDRHGPIRATLMSSLWRLPEFQGMSFAELMAHTWEAWQEMVAELLDAALCPNCDGYGQLGVGKVDCPTCDSVGYVFGREIVDVVRPEYDPALPPPSPGVQRPQRLVPQSWDPSSTGLPDGWVTSRGSGG